MTTHTFKTIEISNYTPSHKTAVWFDGHVDEVVDWNPADYCYSDDVIEGKLQEAQEWLTAAIEKNGWTGEQKAFINTHEIEIED